jgi:hypothetical protein
MAGAAEHHSLSTGSGLIVGCSAAEDDDAGRVPRTDMAASTSLQANNE